MKKVSLLLVLMILATAGYFYFGATPQKKHKKKHNEKYYQTQLCNELDGVMEQRLLDRTRVDCLTDEYAIEVDFAKKWAEGVGQSLYYAEMTEKKPAVGLIVRDNKKDKRHMKRLKVLADKYSIRIFEIERGE